MKLPAVRSHPLERLTHGVQGNMASVGKNAKAVLVPTAPAISGKVIPVKLFSPILLLRWPEGHASNGAAKTLIWMFPPGAMSRFRKLIFKIDVAAYSDDKYSFSLLRYSVILGVKDFPLDTVSG